MRICLGSEGYLELAREQGIQDMAATHLLCDEEGLL